MLTKEPILIPDEYLDRIWEAHEEAVADQLGLDSFCRSSWVKKYYRTIMSKDLNDPDY